MFEQLFTQSATIAHHHSSLYAPNVSSICPPCSPFSDSYNQLCYGRAHEHSATPFLSKPCKRKEQGSVQDLNGGETCGTDQAV